MYVLSYAALLAGFAVAAPPETFVLPIAITNGSTPLIYEVGKVPLDTNYITQPNATSYEWWYFDAVASDLSQHVVFQPIVDYNEDGNEPLNLRLSYSFANGSFQELIIPKEKLFVSTIGQGSAGISSDGAFSWQASPDLSQYTLTLALEDIGISGQIQLQSIAPPHVACSATYPGARLEYHWDLLWVNLLPDSVASVNLMVNGTAIAFEGSGYHDKNWAAYPFLPYLKEWYWGHGRAGEYSVVWFYRVDVSGAVSPSAYVVKDGEIVYTGCGNGVVVRPYGQGVTYPTTFGSNATIEGYTINIDAGLQGNYSFTASQTQSVVSEGSTYHRWIGKFTGGLVGEDYSSGVGLWEQMGPSQ